MSNNIYIINCKNEYEVEDISKEIEEETELEEENDCVICNLVKAIKLLDFEDAHEMLLNFMEGIE